MWRAWNLPAWLMIRPYSTRCLWQYRRYSSGEINVVEVFSTEYTIG